MVHPKTWRRKWPSYAKRLPSLPSSALAGAQARLGNHFIAEERSFCKIVYGVPEPCLKKRLSNLSWPNNSFLGRRRVNWPSSPPKRFLASAAPTLHARDNGQ